MKYLVNLPMKTESASLFSSNPYSQKQLEEMRDKKVRETLSKSRYARFSRSI